MSTWGRLGAAALIVAVAGGSTTVGVAIASRDERAARARDQRVRNDLEARIALLEGLPGKLAGSQDRITRLGRDMASLRQTVESDSHTIKVSGEAYLPTKLQTVELAIAVHPTRSTAGAALAAAEKVATNVTRAAESVGITLSGVRTVWDSTYPSYDKPNFYVANVRVLISVRDARRIDQIVRAVLKGQTSDAGFGYLTVSDEAGEAALASARADALKDAQERAAQYATVLHKRLGTVVSLTEELAPEDAPAVPGEGQGSGEYYGRAFVVVVNVVYALA